MFEIPVFFRLADLSQNTLLTYLGNMPNIRVCDVSDIAIGEGLIYGSVEEYLPFPLKRRTPWYDFTQAVTVFQAENQPMSYGLGFAFLKED